MSLSPSGEMYLKTIATLQEAGSEVHVQDIAHRLGVRMPSVTQALRRLAEKTYVTHSRYGNVTLTPLGEHAAREVRSRHRVLEEFLTRVLHVSSAVASQDACAMEHVVSPVTLQRLAEFLVFVGTNPAGAGDTVRRFAAYSHARDEGRPCAACGADAAAPYAPALELVTSAVPGRAITTADADAAVDSPATSADTAPPASSDDARATQDDATTPPAAAPSPPPATTRRAGSARSPRHA